MLNRFAVNDRAQWYSARALGTVAAVVNGGMAYLFHADGGAKFTVRADELAPIGSPAGVVPTMPAGEARTVFYFRHPQSGAPKQRTPAQQQQSMDRRAAADLDRHITGNGGEDSTGAAAWQKRHDDALAKSAAAAGLRNLRARAARAACREMINGDGTAACVQRTIDLARVALGYDKPSPEIVARLSKVPA